MFKPTKRSPISASIKDVMVARPLHREDAFIVVYEQPASEVDLGHWVQENGKLIKEQLYKNGAILFRGFGIKDMYQFNGLMDKFSKDSLMEYKYRSTPRTQVEGKIYTSTEYPKELHIPMHNEMSYSRSWPGYIGFFCALPATSGGETPLADSRKVYQRIPADIRAEFERKGVMYVRNYSELDLSWQDVFQTSDKKAVEAFCYEAGIQFEWLDEERLRTKQVCQSMVEHPATGDKVWFNQAHLFHVSSLAPMAKESLLSVVSEEELPRHAWFGDGSKIPDSTIALINQIYAEESVTFTWQARDLVLLDNVLTAHGRRPFEGDRSVLVGMF